MSDLDNIHLEHRLKLIKGCICGWEGDSFTAHVRDVTVSALRALPLDKRMEAMGMRPAPSKVRSWSGDEEEGGEDSAQQFRYVRAWGEHYVEARERALRAEGEVERLRAKVDDLEDALWHRIELSEG